MALPFINDGGAAMAVRKREDEVFPNAAGIDIGRRATGWRCRGTWQKAPEMSRYASSVR
jgi:hypothetical protein